MPDAIATKCSKCNEAQKKQAAYILHDLLLYHRAMFFDLCKKYDPTGEARKEYEIEETSKDFFKYNRVNRLDLHMDFFYIQLLKRFENSFLKSRYCK